MRLDIYTPEKYEAAAKNYQLSDTTHVGTPIAIISKTDLDVERFPVVVLNERRQLVGFFVLHIGKGPETYGFHGAKYVLLRGLSIDDRFRRRGYASSALTGLSDFVHKRLLQEISQVVLAVNANNLVAQKTYQKAGFTTLPRVVEGRLGTLLLMEKNLN